MSQPDRDSDSGTSHDGVGAPDAKPAPLFGVSPADGSDGGAPVAEMIVVTGLSGAGLSTVGDVLEDLGWYVIDNLPPPMFSEAVALAAQDDSPAPRLALVAASGPFQGRLQSAIDQMEESGVSVKVVYLEATNETLVRRFEGTRRRHPLPADLVGEAIERDRDLLEPVKFKADVVLDTSSLNVHQLRERIVDLFGTGSNNAEMAISVLSFGYTHGIPLDADLVLDCRFLPNPHWIEGLRAGTGVDRDVSDYVLGQPLARDFLERLDHLLDLLLPAFTSEGKSYLQLAIGCTGGRHRSVAVAEEVGKRLRDRGLHPVVRHRDHQIATTGR